MSYRVGVDTGGTFTDLVALSDRGAMIVHKLPSDPAAPERVLLEGLAGLAGRVSLDVNTFLGECDVVVLGTTVALNTLIQRNGARTGLLVTQGHEDSIEIRLGHKEDGHRWDFRYPAATPIVPAHRRLGVRERVLADGRVHQLLDEAQLREQLHELVRLKVDAVAISCLWSFLHPAHEQRIEVLVREAMPECFVSSSLAILPRLGEYTRTSTTVANAYVGPAMRKYVKQIETALSDEGFAGTLFVMQSNGGVTTPEVLLERPVVALNSGPAGGPVAALWYGEQVGSRDVISVDMGGTSFDICLVKGGLPDVVTSAEVARVRIGLPMVNVTSIGAGGGSIARMDERGLLKVGPESAEAYPGPACYGRGGTQATVTDALVVAGYLPTSGLLGGSMSIAPDRAAEVIRHNIAEPADLDVFDAARGVIELTTRNMVEGIRIASIERGHDPRDYLLVVGGGAGPAFAGLLARELGIKKVLIPRIAGTLCALGGATADLRYDSIRACSAHLSTLSLKSANGLIAEMESEGRDALSNALSDEHRVRIERTAEMKYIDQIHYCDVSVPGGILDGAKIAQLRERFHERHEQLYTYRESENEPEMVSLRVTTVATHAQSAPVPADLGGDADAKPVDHREIALVAPPDIVSVPVYRGDELHSQAEIEGPAIVEEETTTILVPPDTSLVLDRRGFYVMSLRD